MEKPVHTHTHTGIIIMDAHGLAERTRDREREAERDGCLLSSGLPPLWLDRWMTSLNVCVSLSFFLPVSFFCPLFLTRGGGRKGRNGQWRSETANNKYWLIREVEQKKWGEVEERNHLKKERKGRRAALIPAEDTSLHPSTSAHLLWFTCIHLHILLHVSVLHPRSLSCDPKPNLQTSPLCSSHHYAN